LPILLPRWKAFAPASPAIRWIETMLALVFIAVMFSGFSWLSAVNPRAALFSAIFLIPWGGLDVDIGLRVVAWQVALAPLCLVTVLRLTQPGWQPPQLAGGSLLSVLVLYAISWSLLQLGFLPNVAAGDSVLRGPQARAIIQILLYLFALSPVVLVPWLLNGADDLKRVLRIYLASLVVLALIGWFQLALWYGFGTNPLPVGAFNVALGGSEALVHEGQFAFELFNIYRMNSLAGEPRNLATALVLGMLFIQAIVLATKSVPGWKLGGMWLLFLLSVLTTFSTSAALIWPVATFALLPVMWVFGIKVQRSSRSMLIGVLAIVMPLVVGIGVAEARGIPVLDLLAERTLDRLTNDGAVEDFDLAITDYLRAHPAAAVTGVGLGNAHLYATPYLDPVFALYAEGTVFTGKTSVVKMVSEIGFVGLGLFLAWYLTLVFRTRDAVRGHPDLAASVPIAMMTLAVFLNTNQTTGETWTVAGAMMLLVAAHRQSRAALPRTAGLPLRA
jgi:hypothetical protein